MTSREQYFFDQINTRFNEIYIQNQLLQIESQTLLDENIKLKNQIAKLMRELSNSMLQPADIGFDTKTLDYIPKPVEQ